MEYFLIFFERAAWDRSLFPLWNNLWLGPALDVVWVMVRPSIAVDAQIYLEDFPGSFGKWNLAGLLHYPAEKLRFVTSSFFRKVG